MIKKNKIRGLYREWIPLLALVSIQQLISLSVNLADNLMLGAYSETALSGAALVNQIQFLLSSFSFGFGSGVVTLCSQYWGKSQTEPIKRIISLATKFSLLVGIVFWAITFFAPEWCVGLLTTDIEVIAEGAKYLRLMSWTYIIFSISYVLMYSQLSVQTGHIGTIMSGCTLIINVCLNYIFIFGNFGAQRLGIRGAAIATLTSRIVELLIILVYLEIFDKKIKMKIRDLLQLDLSYMWDFIKVTLPVVLSGAQWGFAQGAQTAILGHISATAIAANSIASIIFQLFAVVGMSTASATATIIGNTIGRGEIDRVREYSKSLQRTFLVLGLVTGGLIFALKNVFVGFYSVSAETHDLAIQMLMILAITTIGTCYEYPVESGIVLGGGNTKYATIVDMSFMWLFTIPSAAVCAFVFKAPVFVTFIFLKLDQLLKCIPNSIFVNKFQHKWVKILTR